MKPEGQAHVPVSGFFTHGQSSRHENRHLLSGEMNGFIQQGRRMDGVAVRKPADGVLDVDPKRDEKPEAAYFQRSPWETEVSILS